MLTWMCQWNQAHPNDRVHLYGFDAQLQSHTNTTFLIDYLEILGVAQDGRFKDLPRCAGIDDGAFGTAPYTPEDRADCRKALSKVTKYFDEEEQAIIEETSAADLALARIHLASLQSWNESSAGFSLATYDAREKGMAYLARAIRDLRFPNAKTVLLAHNGHVMWNPTNA